MLNGHSKKLTPSEVFETMPDELSLAFKAMYRNVALNADVIKEAVQTMGGNAQEVGEVIDYVHKIVVAKDLQVARAEVTRLYEGLRGGNFEKQLHERLELAEREKRDAIAVAEANVTNALQKTAAASASSHQAIQILISPHHPYLAQHMAVRQVAQHLHRLRLRLLPGKAQQGAVGFGV